MTMELLLALFTKHFVCDFPLQAFPFMYRNKGTYGHPGGLLHAYIHFLGSLVAVGCVTGNFAVALILGWKQRNVETGELEGFGFEYLPPNTKRALIVDDICDGGGTFLGLGSRIKELFPKVALDLYTTHGYYTQGMVKLKEMFMEIITTDSVIHLTDLGVTTLNVCERIAEDFKYE